MGLFSKKVSEDDFVNIFDGIFKKMDVVLWKKKEFVSLSTDDKSQFQKNLMNRVDDIYDRILFDKLDGLGLIDSYNKALKSGITAVEFCNKNIPNYKDFLKQTAEDIYNEIKDE